MLFYVDIQLYIMMCLIFNVFSLTMSDFFADLYSSNIRLPNSQINEQRDHPYPNGMGNLPLADGKYNATTSLLDNIKPYSGPKTSEISSDRNYRQTAHRKQYPVPPIYVPEPDVTAVQTIQIALPVSFGDVVFLLHGKKKQFILSPRPYTHVSDKVAQIMPNYNCFCNVATANYLLAGIYNRILYLHKTNGTLSANTVSNRGNAWDVYIQHFDMYKDVKRLLDQYRNKDAESENFDVFFVMAVKNILERVVRLNIKPFGIAAHSDMQGGQHEANLNPVQAAASLYTTLTVDGQNVDLNNIWRATDVSGGDKLIFRLEFVEMDIANESGKTIQFGLNHHKKSTVTRSLNLLRAPKPKLSGFFQLVPSTYAHDNDWSTEVVSVGNQNILPNLQNRKFTEEVNNYIDELVKDVHKAKSDDDIFEIKLNLQERFRDVLNYKCNGYWQVAQAYTRKHRVNASFLPNHDMDHFGDVLLQVNWAPVYNHVEMFDSMENVNNSNVDIITKFYGDCISEQELLKFICFVSRDVRAKLLQELVLNVGDGHDGNSDASSVFSGVSSEKQNITQIDTNKKQKTMTTVSAANTSSSNNTSTSNTMKLLPTDVSSSSNSLNDLQKPKRKPAKSKAEARESSINAKTEVMFPNFEDELDKMASSSH